LKSSKVVLVADRRAPQVQRRDTPVRRYRLARVRVASGQQGSESPFEYLKRVYD
jgi:hypothetical protein